MNTRAAAVERYTAASTNISRSGAGGAVPRTFLVTGGRAPAALDLARQLSAQGHIVYAADSLPNPLIRFSNAVQRYYLLPSPRFELKRFTEVLKQIVVECRIDVILPVCEEVFYIAFVKNKLGACEVFADELGKLQQLHSKWEFIQLLRELGLPAPHTRLLRSDADLQKLASRADGSLMLATVSSATVGSETGPNLTNPASSEFIPVDRAASLNTPERTGENGESGIVSHWVLKPVYSRFGDAVRFYSAGDPLPEIRPSAEYPWVAQQAIKGDEYCAYAIVHQGKLQAFTAYPALYTAGRGANVYFRQEISPPLLEWTTEFVSRIGFHGQIAFDFIVEQGGKVYPIECNPRGTSGLHLFGPRDRIDKAIAGNCGDSAIIPRQPKPRMIAAAMLAYGPGSGRAREQSMLAGTRRWFSSLVAGRDVLLDFADLSPALAQGYVAADLWRRARAAGQSLKQFTTQDIEWNGMVDSNE
ncbi:ATP-grasp domain-containing protein [Paenibacillaceae bacterium]|nr:ATP-grasp domain-containing protein [Paenibacillaceae bacterium]